MINVKEVNYPLCLSYHCFDFLVHSLTVHCFIFTTLIGCFQQQQQGVLTEYVLITPLYNTWSAPNSRQTQLEIRW